LKSKLTYPIVRRIHQQAFGRDQEAEIVEDMRHRAGAMLSLVAIRRGEPVAHALFSRVIIECESGFDRGVGLAPIGVLPEHQRTGLGTDLVRHALAALKNRRHGVMVVAGRTRILSALRLQAGAAPSGCAAATRLPSGYRLWRLPLDTGLVRGGRIWSGMRPPSMALSEARLP
jgi:putative acetyltransferase